MRIAPLVLASLSLVTLAACVSTVEDDFGAGPMAISWDLYEEKTDDTGMTTHEVAFVVTNGADERVAHVKLGRFAGCTQQDAPADGPLLTLKCWWAGGGDDFQVRMEGTDTLVIDHRSVDEQADIPEFDPLESVKIPEGVEVVPVAAR